MTNRMMYVKIDYEDKRDLINLLYAKLGNQLEFFNFLRSSTIYYNYFLTRVYMNLVDCIPVYLEIINEPFFFVWTQLWN